MSNKFCIMRISKIKTASHLSQCYNHNYRINDVRNADKNLKEFNEELVSTNGKDFLEIWNERIKSLPYYKDHSLRKNNVRALEILTTFSREQKEHINLDKWKEDNVKWITETFNRNSDKFGNNVISIIYHGDEVGNVHCHAIVIPIDEEGKLNAKSFTNGPQGMRELQDSYGELMKKNHNLERGIPGSAAKHQDIKKFYSLLNIALNPDVPKYIETDTMESYYKKVQEYFSVRDSQLLMTQLESQKEKAALITENKTLKKELAKKERLVEKHRTKLITMEKEESELEREFGTDIERRSKLRSVDNLNEAIKEYPDREKADAIAKEINYLIKWNIRNKRKISSNKDYVQEEI